MADTEDGLDFATWVIALAGLAALAYLALDAAVTAYTRGFQFP